MVDMQFEINIDEKGRFSVPPKLKKTYGWGKYDPALNGDFAKLGPAYDKKSSYPTGVVVVKNHRHGTLIGIKGTDLPLKPRYGDDNYERLLEQYTRFVKECTGLTAEPDDTASLFSINAFSDSLDPEGRLRIPHEFAEHAGILYRKEGEKSARTKGRVVVTDYGQMGIEVWSPEKAKEFVGRFK